MHSVPSMRNKSTGQISVFPLQYSGRSHISLIGLHKEATSLTYQSNIVSILVCLCVRVNVYVCVCVSKGEFVLVIRVKIMSQFKENV